MRKFGYFEKLFLAARWLLPVHEAAVILEDYRDIITEMGEEQAKERLGSPLAAVMEVADRKAVLRWHGVFLLMAVCMLYALAWCFNHDVWFEGHIMVVGLGAVTSLFYFGMGSKQKISAALKVSVAVMVVFCVAVCGVIIYYVFHVQLIVDMAPHAGRITSWFLTGCVFLSAVAGIGGLVLARLFDGRWRVLFVLGLGVTVLCCYVSSILWSMDLHVDITVQAEQIRIAGNCVMITFVGMGVAGVSLC